MNERLEVFRRRLHSASPKMKGLGSNLSERIALVTALTALFFSTVSFYRTVEQKDDFKVIATSEPYVSIDREGRQFFLLMRADLTFINSGTRHAGVYGLKVSLEQSDATGRFHRSCGGNEVSFEVEPFVVKPGELVVRNIEQLPEGWKRHAEGRSIPIPFAKNERPLHVKICYLISFVTPEKAFEDHLVELFIRRFSNEAQEVDDGPIERTLALQSIVTLRSNRDWGL